MRGTLHCLVVLSFIVNFVIGATAAEAQAIVPTRYPYLQDLTTTSVVVAWRTNIRADSVIHYDFTRWADSAQYRFAVSDDAPTTEHALTLTGLFPDTTYYYCVESGGVILASGESFHTARTTSNPRVTFGVTSDQHGGGRWSVAFAEEMREAKVALYLVVGDMCHLHGGPGELNGFFESVKELIKNVPVFPCLGNHDWYEDNGEWYLKEFYLPHNNPEGSELYYSFDYGNAHFVSLCVVEPEMLDWKEGSPQYNWLVNDLENTNQFWKFVYFHFPPYTSGKKYHDRYLDVRETLSPLMEKHGVDIVFNGHEHLYERTKPMADYYEDSKGVVYIVSGTPGGKLHESGWGRWTTYTESQQASATIVYVDGSTLRLEAIRPDGSLMDSMTIDRSQDLLTTMEVNPTVLTEKAEDRWFTVFVEPSTGYDPASIDINSIALNNELKPITDLQYSFVTNPDEYLVDRDGDGLKERVLKFDYRQVRQMLNGKEASIPLRLTGSINGGGFEISNSVYIAPQGAAYKLTIGDVDPGGGVVETADGQILVDFLPGVVTGKARVIIRQEPMKQAPSLPSGLEVGSTHFSLIVADNLVPGAAITITARYGEADITAGVKPQLLTLLRYDEDSGKWTVVPTTVDTAAKTVTVATNYIDGEWILAGETGKTFGLPLWGWIAIAAAFIIVVIFVVWRYT